MLPTNSTKYAYWTLYNAPSFNGLPIMTQHSPMILSFLEKLYATIECARTKYNRLFVFRVDLTFPKHDQHANDPKVISRFIDSFKAKIKEARKGFPHSQQSDVSFMWVKEVGSQDNHIHYHVVFLLNGQTFRSMGDYDSLDDNLINRLRASWASALGLSKEPLPDAPNLRETQLKSLAGSGLVNVSKEGVWLLDSGNPNSAMCNRIYQERLATIFYACSYLCKAYTKHGNDGTRWIGSSQC